MNKRKKIEQKYSKEQIQKLIEEGCIPKEIGEFFIDQLKNSNAITSSQDKFLSALEPSVQNASSTLFNNIDNTSEFGISRIIGDIVYYLVKLIRSTQLKHLINNFYEIQGAVQNSQGDTIKLIYGFEASSLDEAQKIFSHYKNTLRGKGQKVWIAYWKMANIKGRFSYACPMIDIMKLISMQDRKIFFSQKEKTEFWAITRILERTKLVRQRKIKRKWRTDQSTTISYEQRLLDIFGNQGETESYPMAIAVKVLDLTKLDEDIATKRMALLGTGISTETLALSPSDIQLALNLQIRSSQRIGYDILHYDLESLFELGNLADTAASKKSSAKKRLKEKLDRFKDTHIIQNWAEEGPEVRIDLNSTKKKRKIKSL